LKFGTGIGCSFWYRNQQYLSAVLACHIGNIGIVSVISSRIGNIVIGHKHWHWTIFQTLNISSLSVTYQNDTQQILTYEYHFVSINLFLNYVDVGML